jgi:hypothetical protein
MCKLGINTNILKNVIKLGERMIHMVPRDYWTNERIIHHAVRLLKQPMSDKDDTKDVDGASIFSDPPSSDDDNTDGF